MHLIFITYISTHLDNAYLQAYKCLLT